MMVHSRPAMMHAGREMGGRLHSMHDVKKPTIKFVGRDQPIGSSSNGGTNWTRDDPVAHLP